MFFLLFLHFIYHFSIIVLFFFLFFFLEIDAFFMNFPFRSYFTIGFSMIIKQIPPCRTYIFSLLFFLYPIIYFSYLPFFPRFLLVHHFPHFIFCCFIMNFRKVFELSIILFHFQTILFLLNLQKRQSPFHLINIIFCLLQVLQT